MARWRYLVVMVLIMMSGPVLCADIEKWTKEQKWNFAVYSALTTIDALQTHTAMKHGHFKEANPLYGSNASDTELAIGMVARIGMMYFMIDKNRAPKWMTWGLTAITAGAVIHNHSVGVRINVRI